MPSAGRICMSLPLSESKSKIWSWTFYTFIGATLYLSCFGWKGKMEIARLSQRLLQSQSQWPVKISTELYPLRCNLSVTSLYAVTCLLTGNFSKSSTRLLVLYYGNIQWKNECDCKKHWGKHAISLIYLIKFSIFSHNLLPISSFLPMMWYKAE